MCIDGTFKYDEEQDENYLNEPTSFKKQQADEILNAFPEIKHLNYSLLSKEIPCLLISLEKNRKNHVKELHESIVGLESIEGVKMILYVEHTVDANDITVALWRFCNNLDPKRDHFISKKTSRSNPDKYVACMGFDGTLKTKIFDGFDRDWPNIIIADDATIASIDEKWSRLGLGEFLPSPSLKFKGQMYGEEAVANEGGF